MNSAFSYLQGLVSAVKSDFSLDMQQEQTDVLMKESNKVSSVLKMMEFCSDECKLSFNTNSTDDESEFDLRTQCFNSCTAKTFEMKQMESFNRSFF